jgi:hypothetical protein
VAETRLFGKRENLTMKIPGKESANGKRKIEWNRFKRSSGRTVAREGWTVLKCSGSLVGPTQNGFSLICVSSQKLQSWTHAKRHNNYLTIRFKLFILTIKKKLFIKKKKLNHIYDDMT